MRWEGGRDAEWLGRCFWARPARCSAQRRLPTSISLEGGFLSLMTTLLWTPGAEISNRKPALPAGNKQAITWVSSQRTGTSYQTINRELTSMGGKDFGGVALEMLCKWDEMFSWTNCVTGRGLSRSLNREVCWESGRPLVSEHKIRSRKKGNKNIRMKMLV